MCTYVCMWVGGVCVYVWCVCVCVLCVHHLLSLCTMITGASFWEMVYLTYSATKAFPRTLGSTIVSLLVDRAWMVAFHEHQRRD